MTLPASPNAAPLHRNVVMTSTDAVGPVLYFIKPGEKTPTPIRTAFAGLRKEAITDIREWILANMDGLLEPWKIKSFVQADSPFTPAGESILIINNTAQFDVDLPAASSVPNRAYLVKKISASGGVRRVDINPFVGDQIDGSGIESLFSINESRIIFSDGITDWFIF